MAPKEPKTEWSIKADGDHMDATLFDDIRRTWLTSNTLSYNDLKRIYERGASMVPAVAKMPTRKYGFDYRAAEEMYADDPVALAIIERMHRLERLG